MRLETYLRSSLALPLVPAVGLLQLADLPMASVVCMLVFVPGPLLEGYRRRTHAQRSVGSCLAWGCAQLFGTLGTTVLMTAVFFVYILLITQDQLVLANIFLPVTTSLAETGLVACTAAMYTRLVFAKRPMVPGDVSYISMPAMIMSAHAMAESVRLVSLWAGAVRSGSFSWIGAAILGFGLNVLNRLGWIRYCAFRIIEKTLGVGLALRLFAPTSWSKLHDELKIYGGYFRFLRDTWEDFNFLVAVCPIRNRENLHKFSI